jgi:hypothetical protein
MLWVLLVLSVVPGACCSPVPELREDRVVEHHFALTVSECLSTYPRPVDLAVHFRSSAVH